MKTVGHRVMGGRGSVLLMYQLARGKDTEPECIDVRGFRFMQQNLYDTTVYWCRCNPRPSVLLAADLFFYQICGINNTNIKWLNRISFNYFTSS